MAMRGQHAGVCACLYVPARSGKNTGLAPVMPCRPIEVMKTPPGKTSAMQLGGGLACSRLAAYGGMRLREAGLPESTATDVLRHSTTAWCGSSSCARLLRKSAPAAAAGTTPWLRRNRKSGHLRNSLPPQNARQTQGRNEKALEHHCSRACRLVRLAGIEPTTPWFVVNTKFV